MGRRRRRGDRAALDAAIDQLRVGRMFVDRRSRACRLPDVPAGPRRGAEDAGSTHRTDRAGVVRPRGAVAYEYLPAEEPARRGALRALRDRPARHRALR